MYNNAQEQQNKQRKVEEVEKDLKGSALCLDICYPLTLSDLKGAKNYCLIKVKK